MRSIPSTFFRWQPKREVLIPFIAGLTVLALSAALLPTRHISWLYIAIRDMAMVVAVGICFPFWYIRRTGNDLAAFGLTLRRWYLFLPINLALGVLLLLMFMNESPPPANPGLSVSIVWQIAYIMLVGIFETLFFFSFQRTLFERAFGAVPAIALAATFYAFHHVGFQPEFGKLIFVGIIYAVVFRLGNSALLIYPFFWGVGGCYDVLVKSQVVSEIAYPQVRAILLAVLIPAVIIWVWKQSNK